MCSSIHTNSNVVATYMPLSLQLQCNQLKYDTCLKIGWITYGQLSLLSYFCVFKMKNSLDSFQLLKFFLLRWWHMAHHGTFINHLTCVHFKTPIIWWHMTIKVHSSFIFKY